MEDIFRLKLVYYVATLSHGNKCILRINYLRLLCVYRIIVINVRFSGGIRNYFREFRFEHYARISIIRRAPFLILSE